MSPSPSAGLELQQVRVVTMYPYHYANFLVVYSGICMGGTIIQYLFNVLSGCYIALSLI